MSTTEKQVREVEGVTFTLSHDGNQWAATLDRDWRGVEVFAIRDVKWWIGFDDGGFYFAPADATRFSAAIAAAAKLATQLNDEAGQQVTQ